MLNSFKNFKKNAANITKYAQELAKDVFFLSSPLDHRG